MNDKITLHKDTNLFGVDLKAGEYVRKKEWVGLTPTDMGELSATWWKPNEDEMALIDWVEAKLKEKNT